MEKFKFSFIYFKTKKVSQASKGPYCDFQLSEGAMVEFRLLFQVKMP